jgi:DNA repair exonuclease SbcCD nuclease subunit
MSDVHVGSDVYAGEALRGLDDALALARTTKADAILVAGDLFDHHRVSLSTVEGVMDALAATERPVVVVPGNHDTVLTQDLWPGDAPSNVSILREADGEMLFLDELGLAVWGRPVYDHHPGFRPLEGMPPRPWDGWYVPMAHGLFMDFPDGAWRSSPILPDEIAEADCDYIALGHVHVFRDVSQNGVPAFYSGAPSGAKTRGAVLVELDPETGVSVTHLAIGVDEQLQALGG